MKALAWYTIIFNAIIIIVLILTGIGIIPPAPFTLLEDIVWAVLSVPVLILGILAVKKTG
ncbi:hypothetical protein ACFLVH_02645 [Chloroflexota bacterium]